MISLHPSTISFSGEQKLKRKPSAPHFRPSKEELATMTASELQTEKLNAERQRDYHLGKEQGDHYENRPERASEWDFNARVIHAQQRKNAWANFDKVKQELLAKAKQMRVLEVFKEHESKEAQASTAEKSKAQLLSGQEKVEKSASIEKAGE